MCKGNRFNTSVQSKTLFTGTTQKNVAASNVEVLMSTMFLKNNNQISVWNIQSDILIINQSNCESHEEFVFEDKFGQKHLARIISTKQRGLSRSRNMAIENSRGDILLLADDDEVFFDNYPKVILRAYEVVPHADVILFNVKSTRIRREFTSPEKIGYIGAMRCSSVQISFCRNSIKSSNMHFDESMGAGTGNGAGEENKFLFDCLKFGLQIFSFPKIIAQLCCGDSSWFHGYEKLYFINRGYSNRKLLGRVLGLFYVFYWSFVKFKLYRNQATLPQAILWQLMGLFFKY